jgi:hypothetical protein
MVFKKQLDINSSHLIQFHLFLILVEIQAVCWQKNTKRGKNCCHKLLS